jgi:hypothetical protein
MDTNLDGNTSQFTPANGPTNFCAFFNHSKVLSHFTIGSSFPLSKFINEKNIFTNFSRSI